MNINAKTGDKVVVTEDTISNGYSRHQKLVHKHLEINKPYEVHHTIVHGFHTDVILMGMPDIRFNSVNFEDYAD